MRRVPVFFMEIRSFAGKSMLLPQRIIQLTVCKAHIGDGPLLGDNDPADGALCQSAARLGQGDQLAAVGALSRAKRHKALFGHSRHGGIERLLGQPPLRRNTVLGLGLRFCVQCVQRPERRVRQPALLGYHMVQGVAFCKLAVYLIQQAACLRAYLFHYLPSFLHFQIRNQILIIVRFRIYVKCPALCAFLHSFCPSPSCKAAAGLL